MRQRLAQDATSEWSRYAKHPLARARAASHWLLVQLLPLLLRIRFVQYLVDRKSPQQQQKQQQRTLELQKRAGQVFANGLLKLGPLYIKIGQILSCRDKLLPDPWKTAMERLQDQVPAQSGVQAQQLAYASWPGGRESFHQTFTDTNWTPLAAASLGQVHQAVLRENGDMVALKLQRPYLRDIYNRDLALMTKIARTVDKYFGSSAGSMGGVSQSWTEIFADAEEILYREIDYRAEAENAVRFARDFGLAKGGQAAIASTRARDGELLPSAAPWLRTPYVYQHLSTEQVLVMELVSSIKISAKEKLDQANVTAADREYLADCLGRSYLRQFCCNKFCTLLMLLTLLLCCCCCPCWTSKLRLISWQVRCRLTPGCFAFAQFRPIRMRVTSVLSFSI